jgi:hypothetical protein
MGKRGPTARRTATHTGVRLDAALREMLAAAAKDNGQTLSREIETRLSKSFESDAAKADWGGEKTYYFCKLVASMFSHLRITTGVSWFDDAYTFEHAKQAISVLMEFMRPSGSAKPSSDAFPFERRWLQGKKKAASLKTFRKTLEERWWGVIEAQRVVDELEKHSGSRGAQELEWLRQCGSSEERVAEFIKTRGIATILLSKIGRVGVPKEVRELNANNTDLLFDFAYPRNAQKSQRAKSTAKRSHGGING